MTSTVTCGDGLYKTSHLIPTATTKGVMTMTPTEAAHLLHRLTGLRRGPGGLKWSEAKPLHALPLSSPNLQDITQCPGQNRRSVKVWDEGQTVTVC